MALPLRWAALLLTEDSCSPNLATARSFDEMEVRYSENQNI